MGFEPSNPQMVIGSLMKTALPAFEQVLFDKTRPPTVAINDHPTLDSMVIENDNNDISDSQIRIVPEEVR